MGWMLLLTLAALAGEPTLPVLQFEAPAVYPPAALAEGRGASVLLRLEVDLTGAVTRAEVVEPAGDGFDEAAVQAALNFRFQPATDADGNPANAIIGYRYTFEAEAAPVLSVEGQVREAGTRLPMERLRVRLVRGDLERVATTDLDGRFTLAGLDDGGWTVIAEAPGYTTETAELEVERGTVAQVTLSLVSSRPWEQVSEEIEIVGRREAPALTERVLSTAEIRYLPGTNGDVIKVVQNLPGIARPPLGIGQLLIRGTAPEDSAYYLDGGNVPIVFHFSGLSTVFNSDTIDEVAFMPGNYGVRYGRTLGGVVDIRTTTRLPERSRGYLSVDLFQTTAFVEQKLNDRTALAVSGRRSYIDAILNPVLSNGESTVRAPRYYDFQTRLLRDTGGGTFDAMFFLSDDRFRFLGEDADGQDQVQVGFGTAFQKLRIQSREPLDGGWRNELTVTGGPESQSFAIAPDGGAFEKPFNVNLREELYKGAEETGLGWRLGVDLQGGTWRYEYDVPSFRTNEAGDVTRFAPAAYVESTVRAGPAELIPGVRADGYFLEGYDAFAADPRFAIRFPLGTTVPKASFGRYSQFPVVREALEQPDLKPLTSWQTSAGLEQRLGPDVTAEVTGYYNRLQDLVVGREDAFRFFTGPPPAGPLDTDDYANDGVGNIYGVETLLKYEGDRTTAWFAGTFGRSTRVDRPGQDERLFEYDQPVVITALASHQLPRRWRLGARARLSSGNPYTPVVNRFQDFDQRSFQPVYGVRDSERLPTFWSLDARVDKDWVYDTWTLTAYLDLQNATNQQNVEVQSYNYDFSEEEPVTSIPIVPAFGLRGEW